MVLVFARVSEFFLQRIQVSAFFFYKESKSKEKKNSGGNGGRRGVGGVGGGGGGGGAKVSEFLLQGIQISSTKKMGGGCRVGGGVSGWGMGWSK